MAQKINREADVCHDCGGTLPTGGAEFACPGFTDGILKHFCSEDCMNHYEANGYMEAEEDYYCGEDSDPYDY
jgi:hypothetical protein